MPARKRSPAEKKVRLLSRTPVRQHGIVMTPDDLDDGIIMTAHALQRCQLMRIKPQVVRELVKSPAITYLQREGRHIALHAHQDVAAIYFQDHDKKYVVTVLYRTPFSRTE